MLILQAAFDEPIDVVLNHYPGKVLDISNESYKDKKGVWWIKTPGGMKILKKVSNSEETLRFILDAVRHLMKNGVRLPEVCKTTTGSDYVNINGTCYVLTEAIEGRNPSYSVPGELHGISAELARFHKASEGFTPSPGTKPKYHLGLWIDDYARQLEDIKGFYEKDPEFPYFYKRAANAIAGLKGKEYDEWVGKAQSKGSLCHQDFAAGNLILTPTGEIFVLDTDSITIDIPARDIRKLLNKVMKKAGRWDISLAKSIMHSYQSVNPLTVSEWEVVRLDLMFPHLFLGAVSKYYYKRDKEWSEDKYLQRIAEISSFEKTITPVLDNFNKIRPV